MKLSVRVSLVIGILVFVMTIIQGVVAVVVALGIVQEAAESSLDNQAELAAQLVTGTVIDAELGILQELADRAQTRTMVWETQKESLLAEIDPHGYLDFGIVSLGGTAHYMKDDSVSNLADREYIIKALAGQRVVSDVLISRVFGFAVVMFAVPV
jgi:methyl-accepting chemotaxis protein